MRLWYKYVEEALSFRTDSSPALVEERPFGQLSCNHMAAGYKNGDHSAVRKTITFGY